MLEAGSPPHTHTGPPWLEPSLLLRGWKNCLPVSSHMMPGQSPGPPQLPLLLPETYHVDAPVGTTVDVSPTDRGQEAFLLSGEGVTLTQEGRWAGTSQAQRGGRAAPPGAAMREPGAVLICYTC